MKGLLFFLSAVICHTASADYLCFDSSTNTKMQIIEGLQTRLGDTIIDLTKADGLVTELNAQSNVVPGKIFMQKKFSIYPFTGDGVVISSSPSKCGRGGCDHFVLTFATLNLNNQVTQFSCDETSF